eukprot:11134005-Ditylum_brightwellii.AAC.1
MQDVSHALENLANAAVGDRNITSMLVENNAKLTNTNVKLTEANGLLTEQVKKQQDNYLQFHDMIKDIKTNNAGESYSPKNVTQNIEYGPYGYCHSCGYKVPKSHNSFTCRWKKEGHQDGATYSNTMSGSEANKNHNFT